MKSRFLFLGLLSVLVAACGDEPPKEAAAPSPLPDANSDRLWVLARASRVGDGRNCQDHYLKADDPRYQGLIQQCDAWTRNYADYLRINGFPTIEHQHLKDPGYWHWYVDKRSEIQSCRNQLGVLPIPTPADRRKKHYRQRNECDPYDDALNNQKLALTELGVNYK